MQSLEPENSTLLDVTHGIWPSPEDLERNFRLKYGTDAKCAPGPTHRRRWNYYPPSEVYEAICERLVSPGIRWLDVGGGRNLFPGNPALADQLSHRAELLLAADPSENVLENRWAKRVHHGYLETLPPDVGYFDLATARMVAEHIPTPVEFLRSVRNLLRPGGLFALLTVYKWSPSAIAAAVTPLRFHRLMKSLLWQSQARDSFPTHYKMNTISQLQQSAEQVGMRLIEGACPEYCVRSGNVR
jgi:SAM-dependent methyltransferase